MSGNRITPEETLIKEAVVEDGGGKITVLEDDRLVWIILAGRVDLFSGDLKNGKPTGPRHFVAGFEKGQALFGFGSISSEEKTGLFAVGSTDARLGRIPRQYILEQAKGREYLPIIADWVKTWTAKLFFGVTDEFTQKGYSLANAHQHTELQDGQALSVKDEVLWIEIKEGEALVGGWGGVSCETVNLVPLTRNAWMTAVGPAKVFAFDSATIAARGQLGNGLDNFHRIVRDGILIQQQKTNITDFLHLRQRVVADNAMVEDSVAELAAVMNWKEVPRMAAHEREDPLFCACQIVGAFQGINVLPLLKQTEGGLPIRDPLAKMARKSDFRFRKITLSGAWWTKESGALLGFIGEEKYPVAITPAARGKYYLHDVVGQTIKIVDAALAKKLSSTAYTFYRPFPDVPLKLKEILGFAARGLSRDFAMILLLGVGGGLLSLLIPIFTGLIISTIIPSAEGMSLIYLALGCGVAAMASASFQIVRSYATLRGESKIDASLQAAIWDRILKLPPPFFRKFTVGDLSMRAYGVNTIRQTLSGAIKTTLLSGLFSLINIVLLFYYSGPMAILAVMIVAAAMVVVGIGVAWQLKLQRKITNLAGKISGKVLQYINGISKLRTAAAEVRAFAIWARLFSQQRTLTYRARMAFNTIGVFNACYSVIAQAAIFLAMAYLLGSKGNLSTGQFLAFNAAFGQFFGAAMSISITLISVLNIIPIFERVKPILEAKKEVEADSADPGELSGAIEVNHLVFKYHDDGPVVLNDVSIKVKPGSFVALVGPSGSGKSTLLRLLLGFERPTSGSIYYDRAILSDLDLWEVRHQIGVVLQGGRLMAGDIFSNIVGSTSANIDEAWAVAKMVGLDNDIKEMPMGMHTFISEGGSTLSGGQRQRLLIARALINKPRIIFFDEATSALDNATQAIVSESLEKLQATRLVIAHRLSTIHHADYIYVLAGGRIVQHGTYDELIKEPGHFFELAKRQMT